MAKVTLTGTTMLSNARVLVAAALAWLASPWPDIVMGSPSAALFLRSSLYVMMQAAPELRTSPSKEPT